MKWNEFADKIDGQFEDNSSSYIIGNTRIKAISKADEHGLFRIQKRTRCSYGASSHYNSENLEVEYSFKNRIILEKGRITRNNKLQRLGKSIDKQFKIEGQNKSFFKTIVILKETAYLLEHPSSEILFSSKSILFRLTSLGELKEDLWSIFTSIEALKTFTLTEFGNSD